MHFLFKLQRVSLEKHLNGFAVVHLLSVRPASVWEHPLWDDRRERERDQAKAVFYLPPYQHTSHAPPLLTVTGENLRGLRLLLRAPRVCGCIVCIQTSTYGACVCVCVLERPFFPRVVCEVGRS